MPNFTLMPPPKPQYFDANGNPLAGGSVYTFAAGTSNPQATYKDAAGNTAQPNPIPLNARGEPDNPIFWSGAYRVELHDSNGNVVYTVDNYNTDPAGLWGLLAQLAASAGAALVGYIAAGAKAVKRTLLSKVQERVSVHDYMTDAQRADVTNRVGSLDVSAAIQAAIDSLGPNGGQIDFLPGVYLVGSTININGKSNVHLRGAKFSGSWTTSTLGTKIQANASTLDVFSFSNYAYNCTVEGLQITNGARALHFDTCLGWHIYNCNLRENATGLECYGNGVGVVRDCMIRDNTTAGIYLAKSSGDTELCNLDVGGNKANLIISTGGVKIYGGSYFSSKQADGSGVGIKIDRTTASADAVIRNVKVFGCLIGNNDNAIVINGTALAQRDIADVEFIACHIHQDNNGGAGFDNTFAYGYGALVQNVLQGVRFLDCEFIGMRGFAVKAINCYDGIVVKGGSIRSGNAAGIIFDLVQWGRVENVNFISNTGTAIQMTCSNLGDYTQNNRIDGCNFRSNGAVYSEDARSRANLIHDPLGPTLGDFALSATTPLSQIRIPQQGGNQLSLKNQTLYIDGAAWNGNRLVLGSYNFWVDATGRLRIKAGTPISDTDGTVVGSQA